MTTLRHLSGVQHAVYRAYDAVDRLLYVGITCDLDARLGTHGRGARWAAECGRVEVDWFPTRAAALVAEDTAIKTEDPVYNVRGRAPGLLPARVTLNLPPQLYRDLQRWCAMAAEAIDVPRVGVQEVLRAMVRVITEGQARDAEQLILAALRDELSG